MKWKTLFSLIVLIIAGVYSFNNSVITGNIVQEIPEEHGPQIEIVFCQTSNCLKRFLYLAEQAEDIKCAFFDIDHPAIKAILEEKADVVIDGDYSDPIQNAQVEQTSSLMHNKFCIFDDTVWTGSMNPTVRGVEENDNNVVIIQSPALVRNYNSEFEELWNSIFHKGAAVPYPIIRYNGALIENYFCPEDDCKGAVIRNLEEAEESIYFMTFSFTDDDIGDVLVKKHQKGKDVRGVIEARMTGGKYAEYSKLLEAGIDVSKDNNPATMHHKVFIIDNRTVITGSYNPTKNGNERNDENMLIIHDSDVAHTYMKEFERVIGSE